MIRAVVTTFKVLAYSTLGLAFSAAVGPVAYEGWHNENQQDRIDAAISKITQERFFICDPAAAAQMQQDRAAQLANIMHQATSDVRVPWSKSWDIYKSGVNRITNYFPGTTKALEFAFGDIPDNYHKGGYQTALDSTRRNLEDLAVRGVSVCFDKDLSNIKAGSVSGRGMIVLNPALPEKTLAVHVARHLARLDQDVSKPHDRLVTNAQDEREDWDTVTAQLEAYVQSRKGPLYALDAEQDPNTVEFTKVDEKNYKMKFRLGQPEESPAPKPAAPPNNKKPRK